MAVGVFDRVGWCKLRAARQRRGRHGHGTPSLRSLRINDVASRLMDGGSGTFSKPHSFFRALGHVASAVGMRACAGEFAALDN
jgi:hypothetical protein